MSGHRIPEQTSFMYVGTKFMVRALTEGLRKEFKAEGSRIRVADEVEKLAYQLKEEAERTERPIRRLSKVMYGSTWADMQVDVMGECLSSVQHVVGVRSVFLAKRLHVV
ncbi:uncharacterized protein TNCV_823301 [Trichonephila clavipes]|nr:uncharacterized protein TNCV_823301 [Trichonephila clavipes]